MSANSGNIEWYLARDGQQHGQLSDDELRKFIELGHMRPTDLVWRAGFDNWQTAADVFPPTQPLTPPAAQATPRSPVSAAPEPTAAPSPAAASLEDPQQLQSPQSGLQAPGAVGPAAAAQAAQADFHTRPDTFDAQRGALAGNQPYNEPSNADFDADDYEEARGGGIGIAAGVAALLFAGAVSAGGYYAYSNQDKVRALYEQAIGGKSSEPTAIVRAPREVTKEPVPQPATPLRTSATSPVKPPDSTSIPIMRSSLWQTLEQQFPTWTSARVDDVERLTADRQSNRDINAFLVQKLVEFRRSNAGLALSASSAKLEAVALAFVANLQALARIDVRICYDFVSKGEVSPNVLALYGDRNKAATVNSQNLAIVNAIIDAKASPITHAQPLKSDFDALSAELAKRGWSQADLQLFSNPAQLSQAKPDTVCRLVTEWFATQMLLPDAQMRIRLISSSLRPVIAG